MINYDLILGLAFIFFMTGLGSLCVLFLNEQKNGGISYGFSAGVMIAASFWSLLLPAKLQAEQNSGGAFLPLSLGTALGAALIFGLDALFSANALPEGKSKYRRMLIAITVHNVPEGMAVGAAYGAIAQAAILGTARAIGAVNAAGISGGAPFDFSALNFEKYAPAFGVALGIGVQNLPEGFATSLSIKTYCKSTRRAALLGVLSGAVEPVSGLIGAFLAFKLVYFTPWLLAFSAGAMLYVCARDLIPDGCKSFKGIIFFVLGFCVMTALDVALG